jgi:hypothetical protein
LDSSFEADIDVRFLCSIADAELYMLAMILFVHLSSCSLAAVNGEPVSVTDLHGFIAAGAAEKA